VGRLFFENGLGQYHSTHSRKFAAFCKSLFLLTFVSACTLLELVTFEILDFMHPALRLFAWTCSLGILALLLNVLIPGTLAVSVGIHVGLPIWITLALGVVCVLAYQGFMWSIGAILPIAGSLLNHNRNHQEQLISSTVKVGVGSLGSQGINLVGNTSTDSFSVDAVLRWSSYLFRLLLGFDVQRAVAQIAVVGTATAAVISGEHATRYTDTPPRLLHDLSN
jgi:hypothetical protein